VTTTNPAAAMAGAVTAGTAATAAEAEAAVTAAVGTAEAVVEVTSRSTDEPVPDGVPVRRPDGPE
jgi:hypothetical protein